MNPHAPLDPRVAAINGRRCLVPRKSRRCFARFDDDEVLAIRRAWETGVSIVTIAARHGVHRTTISAVVHYERYAHIEPEVAA